MQGTYDVAALETTSNSACRWVQRKGELKTLGVGLEILGFGQIFGAGTLF